VQSTLYDDYVAGSWCRWPINRRSKGYQPRVQSNFPNHKASGLFLHPLEIVSIAKENLVELVASLKERG